jgi:hypothetical protein
VVLEKVKNGSRAKIKMQHRLFKKDDEKKGGERKWQKRTLPQ